MLGDLTKLLEAGYLSDTFSFETPEGEFKFVLKTISPLQESKVFDELDSKGLKEGSDLRFMNLTIWTLAESIQSVNGIDLDKVPGSEGTSPLEKKRSLIGKFSNVLLVGLWNKYRDLQSKTLLKGTEEETEQLKK